MFIVTLVLFFSESFIPRVSFSEGGLVMGLVHRLTYDVNNCVCETTPNFHVVYQVYRPIGDLVHTYMQR